MGTIGVDTLASRINNVINIHRQAEDVTNAEVIGVLGIIIMDLHQEMLEPEEDEDEDDNEELYGKDM